MKMVKSLLLGSAAGLVAVSAGQAADLPVKAKPVEYVKVCSLYGAGFYYMPGTDMCIKIGGYVRAEAGYHTNGSMTWGPFNGNANVRTTNELVFRARGYITADAREQTAWGTARGYIAVGINMNSVGIDTAANQFSANRAFVQWAGFTAGLTQSFFDFYSVPASSYWGIFPASDTGDGGWLVFGYTAQLGNGLSATVSAEGRRTTQIVNVDPADIPAAGFFAVATGSSIGSIGSVAPGAYQTGANTDGVGSSPTLSAVFPGIGAYGGFQVPDVVANIRMDQTWGSAQIMGAVHQVNANAFGISATGTANMISGHPGDEWGWVAGAGLRLNIPYFAQGDFFQTQVNYTQGALRYLFQTPNTNWGKADSSQEAFGVLSDAVFGSTCGNAAFTVGCVRNGLELTTAWNVNAAFEHYWTPAFHSSAYGGYAEIRYDNAANAGLCNIENNAANGATHGAGLFSSTVVGCDNNWNTWWVGSRTQWDITKSFYMGVDVLYQKLDSASINSAGVFSSTSSATATQSPAITGSPVVTGVAGSVKDVDNWAIRFRVHKDFLP